MEHMKMVFNVKINESLDEFEKLAIQGYTEMGVTDLKVTKLPRLHQVICEFIPTEKMLKEAREVINRYAV